MKIGWVVSYFVIMGIFMWEVETRGPLAYLLKGCIEYVLGQELTWK